MIKVKCNYCRCLITELPDLVIWQGDYYHLECTKAAMHESKRSDDNYPPKIQIVLED